AIEAAPWITHLVIQIASGLDLETRQNGGNFLIDLHYLPSNIPACAVLGEKVEKRCVAQVFFQICPLGQVFRVNLRHRQPMPAKSEEHTSELQSQSNLVCRLLLEKKKTIISSRIARTATSC